MGDCRNCDALAKENARLQREVSRLQHQNEQLRQRIQKLMEIITATRRYAASIYHQAVKAMSKHQPRGKWAFHKGAGETAKEVYNKLGGG